jgi:hypothetical protein
LFSYSIVAILCCCFFLGYGGLERCSVGLDWRTTLIWFIAWYSLHRGVRVIAMGLLAVVLTGLVDSFSLPATHPQSREPLQRASSGLRLNWKVSVSRPPA